MLLGVGKVRSIPASFSLAVRLADLQAKVTGVMADLQLGSGDLLVCEAPTTMRDPGAAFKVEQVRGIFETVARARSITVPGRVNPRSVHNELMGYRGRQPSRQLVKETALRLAQALFALDLKRIGFSAGLKNLKRHQDIVDALLVGTLAVARLKNAMSLGLGPEEVFEGLNVRRLQRGVNRKAA